MYDMGARLRELRTAKHLSMTDLAEKLGISLSTVQRQEHNTQIPTAEHIIRLSVLYKVPADYILGLDERKRIITANLTDHQEKLVNGLIKELEGIDSNQE